MIDPQTPQEIEQRSHEIIRQMLQGRALAAENADVILRVIHTTADFDYLDNLCFSPHAVRQGLEALRHGCDIVTDTQMAQAGINKKLLARWGGQTHCFIADSDVAQAAQQRHVTRASIAMEKAATLSKPCIFAIGNAPTALLRLLELWAKGQLMPALVIGVPVGFVHVIESKEQLLDCALPSIVARGRKGGSNVAAAICNALIYRLEKEDHATDHR